MGKATRNVPGLYSWSATRRKIGRPECRCSGTDRPRIFYTVPPCLPPFDLGHSLVATTPQIRDVDGSRLGIDVDVDFEPPISPWYSRCSKLACPMRLAGRVIWVASSRILIGVRRPPRTSREHRKATGRMPKPILISTPCFLTRHARPVSLLLFSPQLDCPN